MDDDIPDWARNCPSGKQKFASGEEARRIFRVELRRRVKGKAFSGTLHTYDCPLCSGFHITHMTHTRRKKKF